jgi:hypothetical protein
VHCGLPPTGGAGPAAIVIDTDVAVELAWSLIVTVYIPSPASVGVPEITPLLGSNESPAGSGEVAVKLVAPVCSMCEGATESAVPTCPLFDG